MKNAFKSPYGQYKMKLYGNGGNLRISSSIELDAIGRALSRSPEMPRQSFTPCQQQIMLEDLTTTYRDYLITSLSIPLT